MEQNKSMQKIILIWLTLLVVEFVLSLFIGKYPLSPGKIVEGDVLQLRVFFTLRLPRTCMAVLAGMALGIAGMIYQTIFHNPLASPDIIGVSSGASVGAAFAILFLTGSQISVTACAFVGGVVAVFIALLLAKAAPGKSTISIVLSGIAVQSLAQTMLMLLKITADSENKLPAIEFWSMGSLNAITMRELPFAALVSSIGISILVLLYRQVLLLSTDEEEAALLGVSVAKMRFYILLVATLIVAAIVSVTGVISFIGLLAPHCARLITKDNRIHTLWLSGALGSGLIILADVLARSVSVSEIPVSVFTSLIGAPFLLYLLVKKEAM